MWIKQLRSALAQFHRPPEAKPATSLLPLIDKLEPRLQLSAVPAAASSYEPANATERRPDLVVWASRPWKYLHGWTLDTHELPGRTLLRLTSAIANIGDGPLELRGGPIRKGKQLVYQRLYEQGEQFTDRFAGRFIFHESHEHVHFNDFATYRLRQVTEGLGVGKVVRSAEKISFCLTDSDAYRRSLPGFPPHGAYFECNTQRQGISVGWADVYDQSLPEQYIDITGVRPGRYWLEVVADPHNRILETNERNNVTRIMVRLPAPAAAEQVRSAPRLFQDRVRIAQQNESPPAIENGLLGLGARDARACGCWA